MLMMTVGVVIQISVNDDTLKNPPPDIKPDSAISIKVPELKNGLVNINTANLHQLWNLEGLSETKARAIIKYREENGNFSSVDDLVRVSGIGEKMLEQIREYLTV